MLAYSVGIILVIVAIWILAIATGWGLPYDLLANGLYWLKANSWESIIIAAFLLLLGLVFITKRRPHIQLSIALASKFGEIRVNQNALSEIIVRSSMSISGVRQVEAEMRQREDGLEITVSSQTNPEVIIPQVSEELQKRVKEDVEMYTGIRVAEVKVLVRGLEPAAIPARVR